MAMKQFLLGMSRVRSWTMEAPSGWQLHTVCVKYLTVRILTFDFYYKLVDHVEYGRATSSTRNGAQDEAARQTLVALMGKE